MKRRASGGFALAEALLALLLATLVALLAVQVLSSAARASLMQPRMADDQQRLRAAVDQLAGWLGVAGQGLTGGGVNQGALPLPAAYPQRRGVLTSDADTGAFGERLTIVSGVDSIATATLETAMVNARDTIRLAASSCAPGRAACGFGVGSHALISDALVFGEWFAVSRVSGGVLEHSAPALTRAYSPTDLAVLSAVDIRAIWFDRSNHQLRVAGPASDVPWLDGVEDFQVRWFGDARPPAGPRPPSGVGNCVLDASGATRLPSLGPPGGLSIELPLSAFRDGPWCGVAPWRFDADLFRVRLLRLTVRLDSVPTSVGAAASLPPVQFDVAPRNLSRQ
ncbi:MAG: hypothetical protein AB7I50_14540 [Vicinamibacterales bacterium]